MRALSGVALVIAIIVSSPFVAQTASAQTAPPQTARQALIEMFFGEAPDHLEKHLPDVTRLTLDKLRRETGQGFPGMFSELAAQSKSGKEKLETFDAGSTFLTVKEPAGGTYEKMEITVERDDLRGDEDQIELALHMIKEGKEESLFPMVLRFLFSMKLESGVWRLNEVGATVRLPLADPAFLKGVEEDQLRQNEQRAQWSVRAVVSAEKSYQVAQGEFACTLSALGSTGKGTGTHRHAYLYDSQVAEGKKNGYSFAISECDAAHYRIVAQPEAADSGQRAFCADDSGKMRSSADGKGATCLASGEAVKDVPDVASMVSAAQADAQSRSATALPSPRVRVSQGVATGLLVSKVQPDYPPIARQSRVEGTVVLKAVINKTGDVVSLEPVSGHPMLLPAAMEAVKQWKYKPYLLNGNAVNVETEVTVNFALSEQ